MQYLQYLFSGGENVAEFDFTHGLSVLNVVGIHAQSVKLGSECLVVCRFGAMCIR